MYVCTFQKNAYVTDLDWQCILTFSILPWAMSVSAWSIGHMQHVLHDQLALCRFVLVSAQADSQLHNVSLLLALETRAHVTRMY